MLNCVDTMDFVETLCALSRSTHAKLHRLWTDMGISTQCQNEAYRQLATRLQTICDNTIQEQEALEAKMCKVLFFCVFCAGLCLRIENLLVFRTLSECNVYP